jgi:hypothetical protein
MSQRRATMKNVKDETKNNLKYIAFLSYYLISPNIIVEDATLANTYNLYPDLETKFKEVFSNLTIKQRFDFIKNLLNGRSINQIKKNASAESIKPIAQKNKEYKEVLPSKNITFDYALLKLTEKVKA